MVYTVKISLPLASFLTKFMHCIDSKAVTFLLSRVLVCPNLASFKLIEIQKSLQQLVDFFVLL